MTSSYNGRLYNTGFYNNTYSIPDVILTGCYDLIHRGHIELFKFASSYGKITVVIDSDEKIKKDKGLDGPFNTLKDRIFVLEGMKYIDKVISFDNEEELKILLKVIRPYYRICGSDWKDKEIVGKEYCKNIIFFDRIEKYSTTNVLNNKKPL